MKSDSWYFRSGAHEPDAGADLFHENHFPSLVIVDDDPALIEYIENILKDKNVRVKSFLEGFEALEFFKTSVPDLILLDVEMPNLSGFQLCQRIRKNPDFDDVPILFLTIHWSDSEKVHGFAAGGSDYILKPFSQQELMARIVSHLDNGLMRSQLRSQTVLLDQLLQEKSFQLNLIAHDIRNPLTAAYFELDLWERSVLLPPEIKLQSQPFMNRVRGHLKRMSDVLGRFMQLAMADASRVGQSEGFSVRGVLNDLVRHQENHAREKQILVSVQGEDGLVWYQDLTFLSQVLENLLSNALKYSPPDSEVILSYQGRERDLVIEVADRGAGIPEDKVNNLFQKFAKIGTRTTGGESSVGLGLYLVKSLTARMGGKVEYFPVPSGGSLFRVTVPRS